MTMPGSVRIFTFSETLISETRRCLPISRWETSTTIFSGMSAGRQEISSSRVTKSRIAALHLHPHGRALELHVDLELEGLVEGHLVEVRVQQLVLHGLDLVLLQDHLAAGAADLQVEEGVLPRRGAQDGPDGLGAHRHVVGALPVP